MKHLLAVVFLLLSSAALAESYVIHAGALFDSVSGRVLEEQSIHVADGKIVSVAAGYEEVADGGQLIDLSDSTVIPGLMDMHVHLDMELTPDIYTEKYTLNPVDLAYRSTVYARRTLLAGFTTVRNIGDTDNITISLRNAIEQGYVEGPRIFSAGKGISVTGGHMDPTSGNSYALMGDPGPLDGVINGPYEARKAVRQRYKDGADVIKVAATGGMLSTTKSGLAPHVAMDELEAIVETAGDYGMVVAAHAHGAEGIKRAVRAGVNSIEHGTELDNEGISLMKQHGAYLVPTMMAPDFAVQKAKVEGYFPEIIMAKVRGFEQSVPAMVNKAYTSGVNIAYGTDSGVTPHGENGKEFALLVGAGMKPEHALQSATINTARVLRIEDEAGSIETGKRADIVAVKGDPLADISLMQNVSFVMKQGKIHKQE